MGVDERGKGLYLHDPIKDEMFWKPADQCVMFEGDSVIPPATVEVPKNVKRQRKRRFKPPTVQLAPVGVKRAKS